MKKEMKHKITTDTCFHGHIRGSCNHRHCSHYRQKLATNTAEMFGTVDDLQKLIYDRWCQITPIARDMTTMSAVASKVAKEYFTKVKKNVDFNTPQIKILITDFSIKRIKGYGKTKGKRSKV
jgi:hypothetical protein